MAGDNIIGVAAGVVIIRVYNNISKRFHEIREQVIFADQLLSVDRV